MLPIGRSDLIDGCRGLSVLLVVIGHLVAFRFGLSSARPFHELGLSLDLIEALVIRVLSPVGEFGVQIFFVISGFLITTLLISEKQTNDRISIKAFYVRRAFRILPAFAVFLVTVFVLRAAGLIQLENSAFGRSAFFLCNVSEFKCSWWLAHTWSLSVEEQFYLIWPLLFVASRTAKLPILWGLLFALTVGSLYFVQLGSFAHIAIGALTASSRHMQRFFVKVATNRTIGIAVGFILLMPLLPTRAALLIDLTRATMPLLTALVFFGTISRKGPLLPLIGNRMIQKIGLISYSVYLWQQLGTAPEVWNETYTGAATLYAHYSIAASLFVVPAAISYFIIERPFIGFGRIWSDKLILKKSHKTRTGPQEGLA